MALCSATAVNDLPALKLGVQVRRNRGGDQRLAFGLPGVGKSYARCAVAQGLIERGHSVLFFPTYSLVQDLLVAKRNLDLPRAYESS